MACMYPATVIFELALVDVTVTPLGVGGARGHVASSSNLHEGSDGCGCATEGRPRAGGNADMSAAREVKRKTAVRGREAELKRDESTRERKRDVSGEKAAVIR